MDNLRDYFLINNAQDCPKHLQTSLCQINSKPVQTSLCLLIDCHQIDFWSSLQDRPCPNQTSLHQNGLKPVCTSQRLLIDWCKIDFWFSLHLHQHLLTDFDFWTSIDNQFTNRYQQDRLQTVCWRPNSEPVLIRPTLTYSSNRQDQHQNWNNRRELPKQLTIYPTKKINDF